MGCAEATGERDDPRIDYVGPRDSLCNNVKFLDVNGWSFAEDPPWAITIARWVCRWQSVIIQIGTLRLTELPTFHFHLQYLNLLRINMQTIESNAASSEGNSHNALHSTICRFPTEILCQIFLYCMPEDEEWKLTSEPDPSVAPMLLTTICRRWRDVVVDMPSLWCKLRMEVDGDWQKRAFCYESYLKQSQGRQSLTLEIHDADWTVPRSLLQLYVDQISNLSIELFRGAGSCPVVAADFGGLQELSIYNCGTAGAIAHSVVQLPPNTHSLKLMNVWLTKTELSSFNPLAWASLTSLEIMVGEFNLIPCLLRLCPNLSSLTMIGTFTGEIETLERLEHTKLQSLRLYSASHFNTHENPSRIFELFDAVTLPNLREVEVRNIGRWPHEEFKELLERSQCPLERLNFGSFVIRKKEELAEYATLLPSLKISMYPRY